MADRLELAIGILASLLANINRDSKSRQQPFAAKDFMMDWAKLLIDKAPEQPEDGMSPEAILAAFDHLISDQDRAGKVVRKDH